MEKMSLELWVIDSTRVDVNGWFTKPVCGNLVAVLHWAGRLAFAGGVINAKRKVTQEEVDQMKTEGIDAWELAMENTRQSYRFVEPMKMGDFPNLMDMPEDVRDSIKMEMAPYRDQLPYIFICDYNAGFQLMCPDRLEEMRKIVGEDEVYIAPTSRHELMVGTKKEMWKVFEDISFVNNSPSIIKPEDVLSDQCFKYADGQLTPCILKQCQFKC